MDRDYQTTMCFELAKTYAKGSAALNEAKEILTFIQQREKLNPALNLTTRTPCAKRKTYSIFIFPYFIRDRAGAMRHQ